MRQTVNYLLTLYTPGLPHLAHISQMWTSAENDFLNVVIPAQAGIQLTNNPDASIIGNGLYY